MRDWAPFLGMPLWVWLFVLPTCLALLCFIGGPRLERPLRPVWRILDGIYLTSGIISAFFMLMILGLIVAQTVSYTHLTLPTILPTIYSV